MKKKIVALISVILIASFLFGSSVTACPIYGRLPMKYSFQAVWEAIFGVQDDVANLQAQVADLQAQIDAFEPETPVGLPAADYDSGWIQIWSGASGIQLHGVTVEHNLGTSDLFVYAYFKGPSYSSSGLYLPWKLTVDDFHWASTTNELRGAIYWAEPLEDMPILIRVLIWKIP
jgi:hypothetical protein